MPNDSTTRIWAELAYSLPRAGTWSARAERHLDCRLCPRAAVTRSCGHGRSEGLRQDRRCVQLAACAPGPVRPPPNAVCDWCSPAPRAPLGLRRLLGAVPWTDPGVVSQSVPNTVPSRSIISEVNRCGSVLPSRQGTATRSACATSLTTSREGPWCTEQVQQGRAAIQDRAPPGHPPVRGT